MKASLVLLFSLAAVSAFTTGNRKDNTENEYRYMESEELKREVNLKDKEEERVADYESYSGYPSYDGYGSGYSGSPIPQVTPDMDLVTLATQVTPDMDLVMATRVTLDMDLVMATQVTPDMDMVTQATQATLDMDLVMAT